MMPTWFSELLNIAPLSLVNEGDSCEINGVTYRISEGILRQEQLISEAQTQTSDVFGFKWHQRSTFEGDSFQEVTRQWLVEKYGEPSTVEWLNSSGREATFLDAGCGAANSAVAYLGSKINELRYIGADISSAVDVASSRFAERDYPGAFLQSDLQNLPFKDNSLDIVFSEGVLHHTDSTEGAIRALARLVKPSGWMVFYVYRKKGPIREYTDDYIREQIRDMSAEDAWDVLIPLSKLGEALGKLDIEIDVPEEIKVLGIPAGPINLQRLFYWHVFKAYYRPELTIDEMNHINFDWYAPTNAHRQSPEQVRRWCVSAGLEVVNEIVELAGITIWARKGS